MKCVFPVPCNISSSGALRGKMHAQLCPEPPWRATTWASRATSPRSRQPVLIYLLSTRLMTAAWPWYPPLVTPEELTPLRQSSRSNMKVYLYNHRCAVITLISKSITHIHFSDGALITMPKVMKFGGKCSRVQRLDTRLRGYPWCFWLSFSPLLMEELIFDTKEYSEDLRDDGFKVLWTMPGTW